jgi:3'(2'), 5'-bisphosphate nucleotidase
MRPYLSLSHAELAAALLGPVLEAGRIEMKHYRSGVAVETKADDSPVTAADREAEAVLLAALAKIAPGIPVVAEEAMAAGHRPDIGDAFFLVDPLDGTREFIRRRGEFTVNVALAIKGRPRFGIVYAPALGEIYVSLADDRAASAKVDVEMPPATIALSDLSDIRTRVPDPRKLVAAASRSHLNAETEAFLRRYHIAERRDAGSSLKFCLLARGDADLYPRLGPTMEWDTAAGHAVLAAAGGSVTTVDGGEFRYGKAGEGYLNGGFVAWATKRPIDPV